MESIIHSEGKGGKSFSSKYSSPRRSESGGGDHHKRGGGKEDVVGKGGGGKSTPRHHPSVLPPALSSRLHQLFADVEKEFEALYVENAHLRNRVSLLEKGASGVHSNQYETDDRTAGSTVEVRETDGGADIEGKENDKASSRAVLKSLKATKSHKNVVKTRQKILKGANYTSKIVSSFKAMPTASIMTSSLTKEYIGHKDGLWDISLSQLGHPLVGTASADKTARVWGVDSGRCLTLYAGHTGSVNGIAFHPTQDLVLTCSGDATGHVWQATPTDPSLGGLLTNSSGDDSPAEGCGGGGPDGEIDNYSSYSTTVRHPISTLAGHHGVVISCQWLNESVAVTAGWDRQANLYNVESGALLQSLVGHDSELTHVACHPTQRLVATCSTDSTFRLWDFRDTIHSVSVFQGHTESVTCAVFTGQQRSGADQIVSGSDDRSVKVWDLRNMRAPLTNIQTQSAVNRLDVSSNGLIAIPQDNRQVVVHDLSSGQKLARLRGSGTDGSSKTHHRMVSAVCWALNQPPSLATTGTDLTSQDLPLTSGAWRTKINLFSAGFDRKAFGWSVRTPTSSSKEDSSSKGKDKTGQDKGKDAGTL